MAARTLLIANRGEIALRVMRTAAELGYRTVAVHSEADATSPHVAFADEAVCIGPPQVAESYLNIERILGAAKASGAGYVHPGYGFLSENAAFATACVEAGLVFVGPPAKAIELMGDKAKAKRLMIGAGVPCVPGYQGEHQADDALIEAAGEIGFPLMVKAAAGGGGRGMRLVHEASELPSALAVARSEAKGAFGSDDLILEKAIIRPRHVEFQVFADAHGNVIHLGERDCSVQRRHQKIIEEAPCPVMTEPLRAEMGTAAVNAARAVDYVGAGTVEFLLDESGAFYFLEMNTRLQVEHPVTELVTGLDLVALQLRVAEGGELGIEQQDVSLFGHAMEVRLYAEDPQRGFLPATGPIHAWHEPAGEGVRVDAGIASPSEITPFYDPMLAKVIAWGETRQESCARLRQALAGTVLFGAPTNRDFLIDALSQPGFTSGAATTAFIEETYGGNDFASPELTPAEHAVAAVLQLKSRQARALSRSLGTAPELMGWGSTGPLVSVVKYGDVELNVALGERDCKVNSPQGEVTVGLRDLGERNARLVVDGAGMEVTFLCRGQDIHVATATRVYSFTDVSLGQGAGADDAASGAVTSPMHGQLLEIFAEEGAQVQRGDRLAILEAMKMQHEVVAEVSGRVSRVVATAGAQIAAGDLILEIEPGG